MPAVVKKKIEKVEAIPCPATTEKVKISLNREILNKYLSVLSTVASSKIIKAANCVGFEVKNGNLSIKSTNLTFYLKFDHGKVDCPDCNFMLPINYISPLVSRSNSRDVTIEQVDHQKFKIITEGEYTFAIMDGVVFPEMHDHSEEFAKLPAADLKYLWQKVSFAASQDVTKSSYLGIYFDGNLVATNGKHIACVETGLKGKFPEIVIPRQVSDVIGRFNGEVSLGLNKNKQLVLKSKEDNFTVVSSLLVFDMLRYKDLFSRFTHKNFFEFNVSTMTASLNRLAIFIDEFTAGVRCKLDGKAKTMTMSAGKADVGTEIINLESYSGPDSLSFIMGHSVVSDLMQVVEDKTCKVKFTSEHDPFMVEDKNLRFMMTLLVDNS